MIYFNYKEKANYTSNIDIKGEEGEKKYRTITIIFHSILEMTKASLSKLSRVEMI